MNGCVSRRRRSGERRRRAPALGAGLAFVVAGACGDAASPPGAERTDFECTSSEQHLWTRCTADGDLEYCHSDYTPLPHFHLILNCPDFGFACQTLALGEAHCVLPDERCAGAVARCREGRAETCRAGYWAVQSCGLSRSCAVEGAEAACVR